MSDKVVQNNSVGVIDYMKRARLQSQERANLN